MNNNWKRNNKIDKPLSIVYKDKSKIFLPKDNNNNPGVAYTIANNIINVNSYQLRKILSVLKDAVSLIKKDSSKFEEARNKLYYIVPLTAYNTGRNKNLKELYNFVYSHINAKAITSIDDIVVLDELFTSIVAYHKILTKS